MNTNSTINKASTTARSAADDGLAAADRAIDSTRNYANEKLEAAGEKVRDLRGTIDPAIERITGQAKDYAQRGLEAAHEARAKAQEQINRYADMTGRYVAEQPMKSVMIAAAAGAAIAALVVLASRSSSRSHY